MQKLIPNLWFNNQAEHAVNFYISIFKNSKIIRYAYYGEAGSRVSGKPIGSVMTISFQLENQEFIAINGGSEFTFSPAISFLVNCETQNELDNLWEKLSADKQFEQCGWLKDKYGVSWQIVPTILQRMLSDGDAKKSENVMRAMLDMKKLDIKALQRAYDGD